MKLLLLIEWSSLLEIDQVLANHVREREFKVTITFVALASMHQLRELLAGKPVETPQVALTIIDIVLRQLAAQRCISVDLFLWLLSSLLFSIKATAN
jgi:eukaryotic translation initiation factor 2C